MQASARLLWIFLDGRMIEDSQPPQRWGCDELRREGFSESVLAALEGVTRREGETCEDVIRRSLTHPVARRVKLADIEDNLDIRRVATLTDRDTERLRRYCRMASPDRSGVGEHSFSEAFAIAPLVDAAECVLR